MSDPVRPRAAWATIVGPPAVATVWFMVVYLAAEAACADGVEGFDKGALRLVIAVSTAVVAALLAAVALKAISLGRRASEHERGDDEAQGLARFLGSTGLMLCGLFAFFVLLVAAPVVGSVLC